MSLYCASDGDGPDLVLLHGWGMNAAVWEPLRAALGGRFRLHRIELPGHGGSAPADAADAGEWAGLCLGAAPQRAHWIGWSLGGQIALQAALDAPDRVSGLSLIGATPRFVQDEHWDSAMPVKTFRAFADALADDPNATLLRFLALQVTGADHARETLKLLRAELELRPPASPAGLEQGLEILLANDLRGRLRQLACPTQWLFGARDTLVPAPVSEAITELLPSASFEIIDGAGHAPLLSHPYRCLDWLMGQVG